MNVVPDAGKMIMCVEVEFPTKWMLVQEAILQYNVNVAPNGEYKSYLFWAENDLADNIFDAIDMNIKINEDAEAREILLNEKVEELTHIFEDESISLDTLKTLEFKFSKTKLKLNDKTVSKVLSENEDKVENKTECEEVAE